MSNKYTIIRFVLFFIFGIIQKNLFDNSWTNIIDYNFIKYILIFYLLFLLFYPKKYENGLLNGVISFLIVFSLGIYFFNDEENGIEKDLSQFINVKKYYVISLETKDLNKSYPKCTFLLKAFENEKGVKEVDDYIKIQIYIKNVDEFSSFKINYGDIFLVKGNLWPMKSPKNPFVFNLKEYYKKEGIYFQDFCFKENFKFIKNQSMNRFMAFVENARFKLNKILLDNIPEDDDIRGFLSAIVLGNREKLTKTIKDAYQKSGAFHILAVSGLHVGMVYAFIIFILSLFFCSFKIKEIIAILFLWLYSFITGFNPPVLRAVTVFTLFTLYRPTTFLFKNAIINTPYNKHIYWIILFLSALFLIVLSPQNIFRTSFQMSYLAVLGILCFYTKIHTTIYNFLPKILAKNKIFDYFFIAPLCTTFSTSIIISPCMLFYFNSLSITQFIVNLIIIPITSVVLVISFFVILTSLCNPIHNFLSFILFNIIYYMNKIVIYFASFKYSSISYLNLNVDLLILSFYTIVIAICIFKKYEIKIVISMFILIGGTFWKYYRPFKIVYNIKPFEAIGYFCGNKCLIEHNIPENQFERIKKYQIEPSLMHYRIKNVKYEFYDEKLKNIN